MNFEDLSIWQEGYKLCVDIYTLFKFCKDYSFKDQICRASVSIPSNIAEGFERDSNKEFIRFLYFSKGSCGELRTQLKIAKSIGYISNEDCEIYSQRIIKLSKMIQSFINKRKSFLNSLNP